MNTCRRCLAPIEQPDTGRPRKWCSDRCRKAAASEEPGVSSASVDPVRPAVDTLLETLDFAADDPRQIAGLLLRQLAGALDETPGNVGLARELRQLLTFLTGVGTAAPLGEVDEERLKLIRHRIGSKIGRQL